MKNYIYYIAFITLFFSCLNVLGQVKTDRVALYGTIVSAQDGVPVPFVHVLNRANRQGTVSNNEGRFWISMGRKDSIVFSAIGYESYTFNLKESMTSNKLEVKIEIDVATRQLQPVEVRAYRSEMALKQAILDMELPTESQSLQLGNYQKESFGNHGKVGSTGSGIALNGSVSALADALSKRGKQKRKLQALKLGEHRYQKITEKYNPYIVKQITDLPSDEIEKFMDFCKLEDNFIISSTTYEITVALHRCLRDYSDALLDK